ncbi:MAG: ABC transporter permease [Acidobacteriota bacterium]
MRSFLAILRRELRAYFVSPLAWVILAFLLFVQGGVFSMIVTALNDPQIPPGVTPYDVFFSNIFFWVTMLFITPVITMRLIAEERRSGTIESLMTAPVTETQVVLAKFFAALAFFGFLWLPTLVYPLIIERNTEIDWGPIASGYLGIFLVGGLFMAIGLFGSVFTKNQIVAAVLSFALVMLLFGGPWTGNFLSDETTKSLLGYAEVTAHMDELGRGIVDTRHLVYFLSTTALFLFLTVRALAAKKWS